MSKHTEGEASTVFQTTLVIGGRNVAQFGVEAGRDESIANASEVVHRWNMFPELLEMLKRVQFSGGSIVDMGCPECSEDNEHDKRCPLGQLIAKAEREG